MDFQRVEIFVAGLWLTLCCLLLVTVPHATKICSVFIQPPPAQLPLLSAAKLLDWQLRINE